MTLKRIVRYFANFEHEAGHWKTFLVIASDRPNTTEGVATIATIGDAIPQGLVQSNHVVAQGGAGAAMQKACTHLEELFGEGGQGMHKLEDDL